MTDDLETLALLLFASRHQSRRTAKRMIREAGGVGNAAELDRTLALIEAHPQRPEIERHVQELAAAALDASMAAEEPPATGTNHPRWFFCEDTRSERTFLMYEHTDCHFIGEIFGPEDDPGECAIVARLDEGQRLGNVLFFDDPPTPERQAVLWAEARRELRIYDKRLGL